MAFYLTSTKHTGTGMFTDEPIMNGAILERFGGELYHLQDCDADRGVYLQVDHEIYLGPSLDRASDYTNHSCAPNCGLLWIAIDEVYLVAIADIPADAELCWDYSTSTAEYGPDRWTMNCSCGAPECRGLIDQFDTLPVKLQQHYIGLGVVPPFAQETIK